MEQLVTLLLGVVIVGYICNYIIQKLNKKTVKSTVDNREYEVRDLPDSLDAANKGYDGDAYQKAITALDGGAVREFRYLEAM